MRRTYRKRTGRKRRTMKTLKIRGGNFDDPDTKDFVNSKIEALEQKISEMESNIPVQIGYKSMLANGGETLFPLFVNKNISVQDFWKYAGQGAQTRPNYNITHIFLPALYSLPNVRGLNIEVCVYSFSISYYEDNKDFTERNVDALNAKYPGLFVK